MDECDIVGQPGDLAEFVTAFQTTPQMRNYIEAWSQSEAKVPIFDEKGDYNILSIYFSQFIYLFITSSDTGNLVSILFI